MATKTITIDLEAYRRLKKQKKSDESFSQVIKRMVPEPVALDAWFNSMGRTPLSDQAATSIEEKIKDRSRKTRSLE